MSDTAQVQGQNSSKKGEEATKLRANSQRTIKRKRVIIGEHRPKEINGEVGDYDPYEVIKGGKVIGYSYYRKEFKILPTRVYFERKIEVITVY